MKNISRYRCFISVHNNDYWLVIIFVLPTVFEIRNKSKKGWLKLSNWWSDLFSLIHSFLWNCCTRFFPFSPRRSTWSCYCAQQIVVILSKNEWVGWCNQPCLAGPREDEQLKPFPLGVQWNYQHLSNICSIDVDHVSIAIYYMVIVLLPSPSWK